MMDNRKRSQIDGGIILIGLGVIFLLNTFGVISGFNWDLLFRFWPVLIILIGLNLIFKETPLWWFSTVIFVLGVIALFIINPEIPYTRHHSYQFMEDGDALRYNMPIKDPINELAIDLNIGAGRLLLDSVNDGNNLYELDIDRRGRRPEIDYFTEGETGYLKIRQSRGMHMSSIMKRTHWQLHLNPGFIHRIDINTGAGEFELDFNDLKIKNLEINSGAAKLTIYMGSVVENVKLNMGAGNVKLYVPKGRAVSIKSGLLISNNNFKEMGLIKTNGYYQTPNFADSTEKIFIEINAPVTNIQLLYYSVE